MYRTIMPTPQLNFDEIMIDRGIIKTLKDDNKTLKDDNKTLKDDNKHLKLRMKHLEVILEYLTRDMKALKRDLDSLKGSLITQPILVSPSPIYYSSYGDPMMYNNTEVADDIKADEVTEVAEIEVTEVTEDIKADEVTEVEVTEVAEDEVTEVADDIKADEVTEVAKKKNKRWADLKDDSDDSDDDEDNKDTSPNDIKTNGNKWKNVIGKNMTKSQDDIILNLDKGGVKILFTHTSINHLTKIGNLTHISGVIEICNKYGIDTAPPKPQEQHRKGNYGKIQDTPTTIYYTDYNGFEKELKFDWFCGYVFWNKFGWAMWILNEAAVFGKKMGITFSVDTQKNTITPEFYSIKKINKKNSSSHKVFSYKDNHYIIIKKHSNNELKQFRKDYFNKKFRPFTK